MQKEQRQNRRNIVINLVEKNFTYKEIGKILGVSRQRAYQMYKDMCSTKVLKEENNNKHYLEGRDFIREKIRRRDNYTCQICGKIWKEGERRFDVHHIDCIKEKSQQYDNFDKEKNNMITLCHKCHLNLPEHRNKMRGIRIKYCESLKINTLDNHEKV